MLILRYHKRVLKFSKMITQLNHLLFFAPVLSEKTITQAHNPSFVSFKSRLFCNYGFDIHPRASLIESPQSPTTGGRVSRYARTEAQKVLFDYLHCTRSLGFADAEHISKNSPHFLQNLIMKLDSEKDVARSLRKYLRYNPINEFEPFFESLGLPPSELPLFLPRRLMFLSDDHLMLENFHVLCNYGIPRSKMGKMYKEAREIFAYDYGLLASKLRAYEDLGLGMGTLIKLVSCCPSLLIGQIKMEFIKVLEKLSKLGIEEDWIGGYISHKSTYNWNRLVDTLDFLAKVGYTEIQMHDLFKSNPSLLLEDSGKKVYVLFVRLVKLGLKMDEAYSIYKQNPVILSGKYVKNILRAVDFLFDIGLGTEDIAGIVSHQILLLGSCTLKGPKTVCKELKVGKEGLCLIIRDDPSKLFTLASKSKLKSSEQASCQNPAKEMEKTTFLLKLGYVENSDELAKASKQFRGRGDQLQERFDCLVNAGLDCHVVTNIVRHAPMVLNQSKDVIQEKIDCLRNCLGYPLHTIAAFPVYLCYNMERINTRFSMYRWLRDKGAAKPNLSLSTVLACSDARFVKYFVDVHPEGPSMWESCKKHGLHNHS
ncbi:transcription termination factor MTEF18, mitochondrial-like [Cucurbita pepo subsp. pepo]|uniref:transcription termination factor MTEF18, mitochondrial-like n=1 Tax=Cucurbita pepo subsp. pepo TaxID=3664 RepID=UPI000C9D5196|nr:transcription termination factor MTEF18, mitochondrial-like [Cucurbita pepo subsp. pepo]